MKHFSIKPFVIAAAIAATGAVSVVTANAATDGAVIDNIVRTFNLWVGETEVTGRVTEYTAEDGNTYERIEFELPENADTAYIIRPDENDDFAEIHTSEYTATLLWGNRLIRCD